MRKNLNCSPDENGGTRHNLAVLLKASGDLDGVNQGKLTSKCCILVFWMFWECGLLESGTELWDMSQIMSPRAELLGYHISWVPLLVSFDCKLNYHFSRLSSRFVHGHSCQDVSSFGSSLSRCVIFRQVACHWCMLQLITNYHIAWVPQFSYLSVSIVSLTITSFSLICPWP